MVTKRRPTGAAVRRAANREQMQSAILEAARTIVTDHGIDALTIRGVATALGYSPGAIYDYFASKEDILCELFFAGTAGLGGALREALAAEPDDASAVTLLVTAARAYRAHALANPQLYRLAFGGLGYVPEPTKAFNDPAWEGGGFDTLVAIVRQGLAEGTLIDAPVAHLVHAAWSAVHGFVSLELQGHITGEHPVNTSEQPAETVSPEAAQDEREAYFESVIRMMLGGIVSAKAREELTVHPSRAGPEHLTLSQTGLTA